MKQPFFFPDHVFPEVEQSFPGLPPSPLEKIKKIENGYHTLVRQVSGGPDIEAELSSSASSASSVSNLTRRLSQNIRASNEDGTTNPYQKKIDVDRMFKWAREAVDFAENQPGLLPEIVNAACDIIVLVSDSEQGLTRFKGAAQYILGVWNRFGLFDRPINTKTALEFFYSSAKSGFPRALYRIGTEYESAGETAKALQYFSQGVKKGDSACLYRMSMCYLRGHLGIDIDVQKGRSLLHQASNTSDPDSAQSSYVFGLVQLNELPNLAPPDPTIPYAAAIQAIERSAWIGFSPALLRMGMAWQGGEKGYDSAIALRYFHIASRQEQYQRYKGNMSAGLGGNAEAEISKWMLCGSVDRFPPNEEMAFYFAKLASEQENGLAEFAVGYFYEVGIWVEQDIKAALIWYGIAASHENADAADRLKELNLNRSNTITKQQHHRTLTMKGRGSIKSFKKKLDLQQKSQQIQNAQQSPQQQPQQQAYYQIQYVNAQQYPDLSTNDGRESPSKSLRLGKLFSKNNNEASGTPKMENLSLNSSTSQHSYAHNFQNENLPMPPATHEAVVDSRPQRARYSFPLTSSTGQEDDHFKASISSLSSASSGRSSPYANGHADINNTVVPNLYPEIEGPRRRSSPISRESMTASISDSTFRHSQVSHIPRKTPSPSHAERDQFSISLGANQSKFAASTGTIQQPPNKDEPHDKEIFNFDNIMDIQKENNTPKEEIEKENLDKNKKEIKKDNSNSSSPSKKAIMNNVLDFIWGGSNSHNEKETNSEVKDKNTSSRDIQNQSESLHLDSQSEQPPQPPPHSSASSTFSRDSDSGSSFNESVSSRLPQKVKTMPMMTGSNVGRYRAPSPYKNTPSEASSNSIPHSMSASVISSSSSIALSPLIHPTDSRISGASSMRSNTSSPSRQIQNNFHAMPNRIGSDIPSIPRPSTTSTYAQNERNVNHNNTDRASTITNNFAETYNGARSVNQSPRSASPGKMTTHPKNPNVVVVHALPSTGRGPQTFADIQEIPVVKPKEDCLIM